MKNVGIWSRRDSAVQEAAYQRYADYRKQTRKSKQEKTKITHKTKGTKRKDRVKNVGIRRRRESAVQEAAYRRYADYRKQTRKFKRPTTEKTSTSKNNLSEFLF